MDHSGHHSSGCARCARTRDDGKPQDDKVDRPTEPGNRAQEPGGQSVLPHFAGALPTTPRGTPPRPKIEGQEVDGTRRKAAVHLGLLWPALRERRQNACNALDQDCLAGAVCFDNGLQRSLPRVAVQVVHGQVSAIAKRAIGEFGDGWVHERLERLLLKFRDVITLHHLSGKTGIEMNQQASLTPNQKQVWDTLLAAGVPLGAYALLDRLKGSNFKAPLQVYRALDKLVEYGMVHRIESLNAFVACAQGHDQEGPTAFAICEICGQVEEFTDPEIGRGLTRWSSNQPFKIAKVTVEMRGLCQCCVEAAR